MLRQPSSGLRLFSSICSRESLKFREDVPWIASESSVLDAEQCRDQLDARPVIYMMAGGADGSRRKSPALRTFHVVEEKG